MWLCHSFLRSINLLKKNDITTIEALKLLEGIWLNEGQSNSPLNFQQVIIEDVAMCETEC